MLIQTDIWSDMGASSIATMQTQLKIHLQTYIFKDMLCNETDKTDRICQQMSYDVMHGDCCYKKHTRVAVIL